MKKLILLMAFIVCLTIGVTAAKDTVELDFRVFSGSNFVEGLTKADIEVLEDGKPQVIDALYQVKNREVVKMEGLEKKPKTNRLFIFIFYLRQFSPRLDEMIDHFFNQVIAPGDALTLMTPESTYNLRGLALRQKTKPELAHQMKGLLRRDINLGSTSYLERLEQLKDVVADFSGGTISQDVGISLMKYTDVLENLEKNRLKEQTNIIKFLSQQRNQKEKKFAFIFYEREVKPDVTSIDMQRFQQQFNNRPDVLTKLQSLFELYTRKTPFNLKELGETFACFDLLVNFVDFNSSRLAAAHNIKMNEYPEDALELFTKMVQATGGMTEHSANLAYFFNTAEAYSSQYYSLQYTSPDPGKKKKTRKIEIKLKNKDYKVYHRMGY